MTESSQVFGHCKRCGRSLKTAKAQSLGYGTVCYKKHKEETEFKLKTGQDFGEGGQTSLPFFMSFSEWHSTTKKEKPILF